MAYDDYRRKVLETIWGDKSGRSWGLCYPLTDAYGPRGYVPPQGEDWSAFRDSSPEAIADMGQKLNV
jgi:hypothetical protein